MFKVKIAKSPDDFEIGKILFKEYAHDIGIDLSFQNFDLEIKTINIQYNIPEGALILIFNNDDVAMACVGIRRLSPSLCELKRMYVKEEFRGQRVGALLLENAIEKAKELDYKKMRLDTLSTMQGAISLYKSHGFEEIESYRFNPMEGALFFEKNLRE